MTRSPLMSRWSRVCLGTLLSVLVTLCASAADPKHVLILYPFGHDVAPFNAVADAFLDTLAREMGEPVDCYQIPLDLARYKDVAEEAPLVDFLTARVKHDPVDLVVLISAHLPGNCRAVANAMPPNVRAAT